MSGWPPVALITARLRDRNKQRLNSVECEWIMGFLQRNQMKHFCFWFSVRHYMYPCDRPIIFVSCPRSRTTETDDGIPMVVLSFCNFTQKFGELNTWWIHSSAYRTAISKTFWCPRGILKVYAGFLSKPMDPEITQIWNLSKLFWCWKILYYTLSYKRVFFFHRVFFSRHYGSFSFYSFIVDQRNRDGRKKKPMMKKIIKEW